MSRDECPHGGALDLMRARFPQAPEPWIDLSTGINPWRIRGHRSRDPPVAGRRTPTTACRNAMRRLRGPEECVLPFRAASYSSASCRPWLDPHGTRVALLRPTFADPAEVCERGRSGRPKHRTLWTPSTRRISSSCATRIIQTARLWNPDGLRRRVPHWPVGAAG